MCCGLPLRLHWMRPCPLDAAGPYTFVMTAQTQRSVLTWLASHTLASSEHFALLLCCRDSHCQVLQRTQGPSVRLTLLLS